MKERTSWRLALMMALLYAAQGAWWPLFTVHLRELGLSGRERGLIFATMAIAAILSPLGFGRIADRFLPAEKMLAIIYAVGSVMLLSAAANLIHSFAALFVLFLCYWLLTVPGLGLSNTIALRHLDRPRDDFGRIRLWGTVGWMGIGWVVSYLMFARGSGGSSRGAFEAFGVGAGLSIGLAIWSRTLPSTPPLAIERQPGSRLDWLGSLTMLRQRSVAVYLVAALGINLTNPFVYQVMPSYLNDRGLPRSWIAASLTLGQVLEIVGLLFLTEILGRFGFRGTLALGALAWTIRFGSLALDPPIWWAVGGTLLHGIGIAFFTVGGQIYLDRQSHPARRAGAQALNVVVTTGVGSLLGNLLAGEIVSQTSGNSRIVFGIPFAIDLSMLALLVFFFQPERESKKRDPKLTVDLPPAIASQSTRFTMT